MVLKALLPRAFRIPNFSQGLWFRMSFLSPHPPHPHSGFVSLAFDGYHSPPQPRTERVGTSAEATIQVSLVLDTLCFGLRVYWYGLRVWGFWVVGLQAWVLRMLRKLGVQHFAMLSMFN